MAVAIKLYVIIRNKEARGRYFLFILPDLFSTLGGAPNPGAPPTLSEFDQRVNNALATNLTTPKTASEWISLATYNENLADKEWRLMNDRTTWMLNSQAFLFAAFCLVLINRDRSPETARILLNLIPVIALLIVAGAIIGIQAAVLVTKTLEHERSFYQAVIAKLFGITIPDIGFRRTGPLQRTYWMGRIPLVTITIVLLALWILIILSRLHFGIDIGINDLK